MERSVGIMSHTLTQMDIHSSVSGQGDQKLTVSGSSERGIFYTFQLVLASFLWIIILAGSSFAQQPSRTHVVKAEGMGVIINNNNTLARDNAIEDALRKAVEQAVGIFVSSETMVESFQVLNDRIYTKMESYIENYRIISEVPMDNIYKIIIEATVTSGNLKKDLSDAGILMAIKQKPRVMLLMAEQNIGREHFRYWWGHHASEADLSITETVFMEKLNEENFKVIDHGAKSGTIKVHKAYRVASLDDNVAVSLGNQFDAEVVIVGKALAKYIGNVAGSSMKSCQANISARGVRTDNGSVIASGTAHGAAVHIDQVSAGSEALKKASSDLISQLMEQMVSVWGKETEGTTLVQMTINGISGYRDFLKLKNVMKKQVRGVEDIHQRSMTAGVAKLDIEVKGDGQSLADGLAMKNFENFSINITDVSPNYIELTIISKIR